MFGGSSTLEKKDYKREHYLKLKIWEIIYYQPRLPQLNIT